MIIQLICILIFLSTIPTTALSRLIELSNSQMENIVAQAGITIGISNYKTYRYFKYIGYEDTDTNGTIFLKDIELMETLNTGNVDTNGDNLQSGVIIDVFQNPDSIPMVSYIADDFDHKFSLHTADIDFCNTSIGSLDIDEFHPYSERYYATGHSDGVDFQYNLGLEMTNLDYKYQNNPANTPPYKSLHIDKLYLVNSFTDNPNDDPTDPSTWIGKGQFQFGDLNPYGSSNYTPATFDVGVDPDTNLAQMVISLPMKGSIRISDLRVGDNDFGPIAIDGINVHHMVIRLIP